MTTRVSSNIALPTLTTAAVSAVDTTINVTSTAGWPTPGVGEVGIGALDMGKSIIELFSYTGKTANSFTGVVRGIDDTDPRTHAPKARVTHVYSAKDLDKIIFNTEKGQPLGVATLGSDGIVPDDQLPATTALTADAVAFTPSGSVAATDVQAAILEVVADFNDALSSIDLSSRVAKSGDTMTGVLIIDDSGGFGVGTFGPTGMSYTDGAGGNLAADALGIGIVDSNGGLSLRKSTTNELLVNGDPVATEDYVDDAISGLSTAPSGPAGGVLGGTYPNPGFAVDMATQAELDFLGNIVVGLSTSLNDEQADRIQADALKVDKAGDTMSGTLVVGDVVGSTSTIYEGAAVFAAGGKTATIDPSDSIVIRGAVQAGYLFENALSLQDDNTNMTISKNAAGQLLINGVIAVVTTDGRLTDARTPTGAAGGVLGGTFPSPAFAVDMATQAELDAEALARSNADALKVSKSGDTMTGELIVDTSDIVAGTAFTADSGIGTVVNIYADENNGDAPSAGVFIRGSNDTFTILTSDTETNQIQVSDADGDLIINKSSTNKLLVNDEAVATEDYADGLFALAATKAATTDLINAKGDRLIGSTDNTLVAKAAPANGKFSVADSAQSDGWKDIDLPWHVSIDPVRVPAYSTTGGSIAAWATYYQFSALNNEVVYNVQLGPGTWTFGLWRTIFSSYGILTVTLDGTTIATLDNYSVAPVNPGQSLTTGIVISAPGVYALKLKTTGKNASSSNYNQRLWSMDFTRTA